MTITIIVTLVARLVIALSAAQQYEEPETLGDGIFYATYESGAEFEDVATSIYGN